VNPVPAQMWAGVSPVRGEPSPGADVRGGEPSVRAAAQRRQHVDHIADLLLLVRAEHLVPTSTIVSPHGVVYHGTLAHKAWYVISHCMLCPTAPCCLISTVSRAARYPAPRVLYLVHALGNARHWRVNWMCTCYFRTEWAGARPAPAHPWAG
jgi:hypothetical protein